MRGPNLHALLFLAGFLLAGWACPFCCDRALGQDFESYRVLPAGDETVGLATADVDADGIPDLVATNRLSGSLTTYLGEGNGLYGPRIDSAAVPGSTTIGLGDFDGDGLPDAVVGGDNPAGITLFAGDGAGGFPAGGFQALSAPPRRLALADFDADGNLDVVAALDGGSVVLLGGDGAGGFATPTTVGFTAPALDLESGDVDGDAIPDLALAGRVISPSIDIGLLYVLIGDGAGGFEDLWGGPFVFPAATHPTGLAAADLDGDGVADLAIAAVRIIDDFGMIVPTGELWRWAIPMAEPQLVMTVESEEGFAEPVALTAGNIDLDGDIDLVMGLRPNIYDIFGPFPRTGSLRVIHGDGGGGFAQGPELGGHLEGGDPLVVGDPVGGYPHLAQANAGSIYQGTIAIYRQSCVQALAGPRSMGPIGWIEGLRTAGDLDGDGHLDIAVASPCFGDICGWHFEVIFGDGAGGGSAWSYFPYAVTPIDFAPMDIVGTPGLDLVITDAQDPQVAILEGPDFGVFAQIPVTGMIPHRIEAGDLNGDAFPDLVLTGAADGIAVMLGIPGPSFLSPAIHATAGAPNRIVIVDLDEDGNQDVAAACPDTDSVAVLLGDGAGGFGPALALPVGSAPGAVAAGDVDGDGVPDLVTANHGGDSFSLLIGTGAGTFLPAVESPTGRRPIWVEIVDLDADGALDLALLARDDGAAAVHRGDGAGGFEAPLLFGVRDSLYAFAAGVQMQVGDFDEDGLPDLAAGARMALISILLNRSDFTFDDCDGNGNPDDCDPDCDGDGIPDACEIAQGALDLNGNGIPDECEGFIRADVNEDGAVDIGDPIFGLEYLFLGGPSPCLEAHDSNGDGVVNIADPVHTLEFLFNAGPPPPPPFPGCGFGATNDLGCLTHGFCD